ncbi:unnamed protein product, partial [Nesidiocoris tenuis]
MKANFTKPYYIFPNLIKFLARTSDKPAGTCKSRFVLHGGDKETNGLPNLGFWYGHEVYIKAYGCVTLLLP